MAHRGKLLALRQGVASRNATKVQNVPRESEENKENVPFAGNVTSDTTFRGSAPGRGSHSGTEFHKEPPAFQSSEYTHDVNQNVIGGGRGGRGGRGGHYQSGAEPATAPAQATQNGSARGGFGSSRGGRGQSAVNHGEVEPAMAPAPVVTQNGNARGDIGSSRGGRGQSAFNRGEDLAGHTPVATGYGRPLIALPAQIDVKRDSSSEKAQTLSIDTSSAEDFQIKSILKKTVPEGAVKDNGNGIHCSAEQMEEFDKIIGEVMESFTNLKNFIKKLTKKSSN